MDYSLTFALHDSNGVRFLWCHCCQNKEKQTINPFRKYQSKTTEKIYFATKTCLIITRVSGTYLFNLSVYAVTSSHMVVNSLVRQLVVTLGV